MKNKYDLWDSYRGKIKSSKGQWQVGHGVRSHGMDMMTEIVGSYSYMQVVVLNATGKKITHNLAQWFEAIHICLSWPDPRIWCNRIGAIAGSSGVSSIAATCAGTLAADSNSYGGRTLIAGVQFIQRAMESIDKASMSTEDFVDLELKSMAGKPYIMGYARPLATGDERIPAMERVAASLGFSVGGHLKLAYEIEHVLNQKFSETMNINGYISAFLSDEGFSPDDVSRIFTVLVFSGVTACYVDAANREQGTFSPLRVDDVKYTGKAAREFLL